MPTAQRWRHWLLGLGALVLLDASLTFQNVWPTPAIQWTPVFSVEVAGLVLVLAVAGTASWRMSRPVLRVLAGCWVLLVLARYEYVTAPALFGRELNLYFDVRYLPDVTAMIARAAPAWTVVAAAATAALGLGLLYALLYWALRQTATLVADRAAHRVVVAVAAVVVTVFAAERVSARIPGRTWFGVPVTGVYARQVALTVDALRRSRTVPPSPRIQSDLSRVQGADVFLFFIESYGAVSFERPELARGIEPARRQFERAVHDTGRGVVTTYVESPTFGGNSWLAHITLLSGIETRDIDASKLLMMQPRDTLVKLFARHGYRAVALEPGQRELWPEGSFYGFADIYDAARLDYHGPKFGWFTIPDQFTLARLDALEADRHSRAPLFVFFPTLSTHTPFEPLPPYQADWARMLTDEPYDPVEAARAVAREPNWLNMGASYVDAVVYEFQTLAGYLRAHPARDLVLILIGDHQPPAVVSGKGASWDVPVHVITSRQEVLRRLVAHGFRPGIDAARPALGKMQTLLPVLLDAFGDDTTSSVAAAH